MAGRRATERRIERRTYPRDAFVIANRFPVRVFTVRSYNPLSDRRVFDFERRTRPAFVSIGPRAAARHVVRSYVPGLSVPHALGFADPRRVDLCKRREDRRRAIMATGKGGRTRRGRKNEFSDIHC